LFHWKVEKAIRAPVLRVEVAEVDLGAMPPNTIASRSLRLWNAGARPLRIVEVRTSCGCTEAKLENSLLRPGESTTLSATIKSRNLRGPGQVTIEVCSNDPLRPVTRLTLRFTTGEDAYVEPSVIDFGNIAASMLPQTKTTKLILGSGGGLNLDFGEVHLSSDSPYVLPVTSLTGTANTRMLSITVKAGAPIGQIRSTIHIRDRNGKIDLGLNVHGRVSGRFRASPAPLIVGPVSRSGGDGSEKVIITGPAEGLQIASWKVGDSLGGLLRLEVVHATARVSTVVVTVDGARFPELSSQKRYSGDVILTCRSEGLAPETLTIPVVVFLQPDTSHRIH
jgi:hypothetical protein